MFYIAHFAIFGFGELLITNNLFKKCKQNVTANLNAQVVETSVTVNNNSPIQDYVHPDHQTHQLFKWISLINFSLQRFSAKRTRKATKEQTAAERKRARFLTEVGTEVYSTLSNLLAPTKPKDTPIVDIVRVLEKHYNPKPLEIAQSFHIGSRNQKSGESVGDYVLALKRLTVHCNYGEFLNRALRDRFVCSLSNPKI